MQGRGFGGGDGDRDPRLCCWRVPVADLWVICAGQRWWQEEMCRRSRQGSWGWPGSRWAHPRGCSQGAGTRLGGCSGRGQGAELAPGCPTPRKGSGVPHLHPQPPSLPPPGQESLGSQPGSRCVLVDVDTNPFRTGLCPRARGLPAPKPWGHPLSCCQPGSSAEIGVCGKCLSPWEWDGLQRDPQSRWSQTLRIPPSPTLPALDGVTFVPPIPGPRGAAGTHTGLWGHVQGAHLGGCGDTMRGSGLLHWGCTVGPGGHQDFRGAQGCAVGSGGWTHPGAHCSPPALAVATTEGPAAGTEEKEEKPRSSTHSRVAGSGRRASIAPGGQATALPLLHRQSRRAPLAATVSMY